MASTTRALVAVTASVAAAGAAALVMRAVLPLPNADPRLASGRGSAGPGARPEPPPRTTTSRHSGELGPAHRRALARSIDATVEQQLARFQLPGALVVVVYHGEVLFSRGYGYADVVSGRRFDAERSVFRTASVSKLFTSTAVMQLVEQGRLDLAEDVNTYLDFQVPATYAAPVTLRHLLTHTAGFDERLLGSSSSRRRPEDLLTLRQSLTAPDAAPRVRPPGQVISYSNHGMALAGYIVERVSGKPFARYIDDHIHRPLGMARSTFSEPLNASLERDRVYGHRQGGNVRLPVAFENGAPAGSHFSTGADIARFMLAHLGGGALEGGRILGPDAAKQLHAQAFTHHPRLPGWTLGFTEYRLDGWRMIGHGGDLPGAHNQLTLVPAAGLGVFVHLNGEWAVRVDDDPRMRIVEHVVRSVLPTGHRRGSVARPTVTAAPAVGSVAADAAVRVSGNYRYTRHATTSIEKLLVPNSFLRLHVLQRADGTLRMHMPLGLYADTDWVPVEPLLYRRIDADEYLAFRAERGRATHLFPTLMVPLAFERVRWYESEAALLGGLGFSTLAFLGAALEEPAAALVRRLRRRALRVRSMDRWRRQLGRALGIAGVGTLGILGLMAGQAVTTGRTPLLPVQPLLEGAVVICGVLTLGLGYSTARAWIANEDDPARRIACSALTVAGAVFVWQMVYWNVLRI